MKVRSCKPIVSVFGIFCLLLSLPHGALSQASAGAEDKPVTFSPDAEKKLQEFYGKVRESLRKFRIDQMEAKIAEVGKITGLDDAGKLALKEPAKKAAEVSTDKTVASMEKMMRSQYRMMPEQVEDTLDQLLSQDVQASQFGSFSGDTQPEDESLWTESLRQTLSPEQWTTYRKAEDERVANLRKQIDGVLKASVEWVQKQQEEYMLGKAADVKQGLKLPEDRAKKLDEIARTVSEAAAKDWTTTLQKVLMNMPEQNRRQVVKQGRYFMAMDEDSVKKSDEQWAQRVQEILTPDEVKQVAVAKAEDKATRAKALGLVLVSMLDERVAFTNSQREQLKSVAEEAIKKQDVLFPPSTAQHFSINTSVFFTTAAQVTDEQLTPILTSQQIARWRDACDPKTQRTNNVFINRGLNAQQKKAEPQPVIEPEEVEEIISNFLIEREVEERKKLAAEATLKAEDAARVAALGPEALARLLLAAQGTTELGLTNWRNNAEQNVRSQLANLNPQQIRQRLDGMESYQFYSGRSTVQVPLWDNTVKQTLTPEQLAVWTQEVDHRAAFRRQAAAASILTEFDRKYAATAEQSTKLQAFLTKFLEEYSPDIEGMFSPNNSSPWYLQTYSMFLPFGSLDEKQILDYMTKEQWERLKGSNEYSNATNYWENVEQQHKQRVKNKG